MSLIEIPVRPDKDPDGRRMRELLDVLLGAERAGLIRSLAIHALAVLGIPLWLGAAFPHDVNRVVRRVVLGLFVAAMMFAILASIAAFKRERLRRRLMEENEVKVIDEAEVSLVR